MTELVVPSATRGSARQTPPSRCRRALRTRRHARRPAPRHLGAHRVSTLRARCPDCGTLTAVAIGTEYQCQLRPRVCCRARARPPGVGRRRRGDGGRGAAEPSLPRGRHGGGSRRSRSRSPRRPKPPGAPSRSRRLLLRPRRRDPRPRRAPRPARGRLVRRARRPQHSESSPSFGNAWGCRYAWRSTPAPWLPRMSRSSVPAASIHRRSAYLAATGIDRHDINRYISGCDRVYVAFDCDVLRPGELSVFMPEPGGPTIAGRLSLRGIAERRALAGLGLTGLSDEADATVVARLVAAAGL